MTTGRANGPATVMWIARSLLVCLFVIASTNLAAAQHDTANAGALDGFAGAIATAGDMWELKKHKLADGPSRPAYVWESHGDGHPQRPTS